MADAKKVEWSDKETYAVEMKSISKIYPNGVAANQSVDLFDGRKRRG